MPQNIIHFLCKYKWIDSNGNIISFSTTDGNNVSYIDESFGVLFETGKEIKVDNIPDLLLDEIFISKDSEYEKVLENRYSVIEAYVKHVSKNDIMILVTRKIGENLFVEYYFFHLTTDEKLIISFASVEPTYCFDSNNFLDFKEYITTYIKQP